jgi:hypothetical protein
VPETQQRPEPVLTPAAPVVPDGNVWSSKKAGNSLDFTCPSGQTCRLRKLTPERLLESGMLDRISRLEGLASELVDRAEGQPPVRKMPSREDLAMLLETINVVIPLAVEEPQVWADSATEAEITAAGADPANVIRCSDIDLDDRMAILEESLKGIRALDRFRNPR